MAEKTNEGAPEASSDSKPQGADAAPAIVVRDLVARHGHNLGHRKLASGEAWARIQFRSDEDAAAFAATLRWSAFDHVPVDVAALGATPAPVPDAPELGKLRDELKAAKAALTKATGELKDERAAHVLTKGKLTEADEAIEKLKKGPGKTKPKG